MDVRSPLSVDREPSVTFYVAHHFSCSVNGKRIAENGNSVLQIVTEENFERLDGLVHVFRDPVRPNVTGARN